MVQDRLHTPVTRLLQTIRQDPEHFLYHRTTKYPRRRILNKDRNHLLLLREQPMSMYKIEETMPTRGILEMQERATEQEVTLTL